MSDLSIAYRERLARLGGGGRRESESSSTLVDMTTSTRRVRSGANRSVSHEYKQARSEMRGNVVSTRSDAAALQNDLAQRYNLQNAVRPLQKKKRGQRESTNPSHRIGQSEITSNSTTRTPPPRQCASCQATNPFNSSVCETCGYYMAGTQQIPLTMAQSRGLVAAPAAAPEALKKFEWDSIEKGLASRQDAYCPICMEGFNQGFEVLLSCSHMYHRSCLQSFEKFMKSAERSCPICRTTNYQKKITHAGTKAFETVCALTIQKNWRGYFCRYLYYEELKRFYKNGGVRSTICKKKFYEKELSNHTYRLTKEGDSMKNEVDSLFSSMDKVMQDNRDLDLQFEQMMMERHNYCANITETSSMSDDAKFDHQCEIYEDDGEVSRLEWHGILNRCLDRGDNVECAICMSELVKNRNRRVVLLSCSHMYHQQCIMMLEDFVKNSEDCPLCPLCRCPFERKLLARDCKSFDDRRLRK